MATEQETNLPQLPPEVTEIGIFNGVENQPVTNDTEIALAGQKVIEMEAHIEKGEKVKELLFGPIKRHIKSFEDLFRDKTKKPLTLKIDILTDKINALMTRRQKEKDDAARKEHEEKLAAERKKATETANIAMTTGSDRAAEVAINAQKNVTRLETKEVRSSQTMRTGNFTIAETRHWEWKVVDPNLIPRSFFVLDEKQLNQIAKKYSEAKVLVPGVEFNQVSRAAFRA